MSTFSYSILKVKVASDDVEAMYRLGKREQDKTRPLLVRFSNEEKKVEVLKNLKELKGAEDRFRVVSVTHDLTVSQRELVKEVRRRAMEEEENRKSGDQQGNYRIVVVGQTSSKPRAVRIPIRA